MTIRNGIVGASFVDSAVTNGTTYYYILTATNPLGESSASVEASATPVPSVGSNIRVSLTASGVTVSWPANYVGWILQTNTADAGIRADWGDVPDSLTNSQMTFPAVGNDTRAEFFRLRHP